MKTYLEVRCSISALLDAGKSVTEISRDLSCSRPTVYKIKNLKAQGKGLHHQYPVRSNPVLTPQVRTAVKRRIRSAPQKPLRKIAREAGLNREAVRRVVRQEGWRSLRRKKIPCAPMRQGYAAWRAPRA